MSANFYELLKYASTGIASPSMTYFDRMRASTLMGGKVQTLTGIPPLSFEANGKPLISWSMLGNTQQTGTPSPDNIIMPDFCGKLVGTDWTIPITCAGQTVPVYLGQTPTVRRVKKLVLTGEERWQIAGDSENTYRFFYVVGDADVASDSAARKAAKCTHFKYGSAESATSGNGKFDIVTSVGGTLRINNSGLAFNVADFKSYLAAQYAAGTPVTVWYVLATPETGIVNEPLAKIGDYADELHSTDAGVTIPTGKGDNTLTVDTELEPSAMTIQYRG